MTSIPSTSPIVITPPNLVNTLDTGLLTDQTNLAGLEQQIATGNAINAPSDNPAGAANMLQLQGSLTRANQYQANAKDATGWLTLANSTASSVINQIQQVNSLIAGVSGSNLTGQTTTRTSTADQIASALHELTNLANTTYEGNQPIFAGTGSITQAYDQNGNYLGAGTAPLRTVAPGTQVPVSVTGPAIFGTGTTGLLGNGQGTDPKTGAPTPIGLLQQAINDLNSGSSAAMTDLTTNVQPKLQQALSQAETAAGTLGAAQQQSEGFSQQANDAVTALDQQLGAVQSTNVAQAITSLQLQQTAYQEALYATSQLSTDSLAKYL